MCIRVLWRRDDRAYVCTPTGGRWLKGWVAWERERGAKPVIYCLADHKRLRALVIYDAITHYGRGEWCVCAWVAGWQLVHANAVFVHARDIYTRRKTRGPVVVCTGTPEKVFTLSCIRTFARFANWHYIFALAHVYTYVTHTHTHTNYIHSAESITRGA